MKTIIENVIATGNFELNDMLKKIDTLWIQGDLTDEERAECIALAQEKAKPENTYAPLQAQIDKLAQELSALAARVALIEEGTPQEPPQPGEEWPEYVQPQGAHDAYYRGDKITFEGAHYVCTAPEGTACVWSPAAYPAYWEQQV